MDAELKVNDALADVLATTGLVGSGTKMKNLIEETLTSLESALATARTQMRLAIKNKKESKFLDEKVLWLTKAKDVIAEVAHEVATAKSFVKKTLPKASPEEATTHTQGA